VSTLIVGCGYLGRRVGTMLRERGERVFGTTRSAAGADQLAALGIEPIVADVLDPGSLEAMPDTERIFSCVGFDRSAGVAMRAVYVEGLSNVLERSRGRFVYASSTGVYGQDDGAWVDEEAATEPRHESGRIACEAEDRLRAMAANQSRPWVILRFAGLYGPGRIIQRAHIERGEPIRGDPARFLNLIHSDDAARAAIAALERGVEARIYNVCDDRPIPRREYYERLAEALDVEPPRFEPPAPGSMEARRDQTNKRVANRRMKTELGVTLTYPDFTTGLHAALAAEARAPSERSMP
jgi:nucleoside-diphosphate-sugar epimerase